MIRNSGIDQQVMNTFYAAILEIVGNDSIHNIHDGSGRTETEICVQHKYDMLQLERGIEALLHGAALPVQTRYVTLQPIHIMKGLSGEAMLPVLDLMLDNMPPGISNNFLHQVTHWLFHSTYWDNLFTIYCNPLDNWSLLKVTIR